MEMPSELQNKLVLLLEKAGLSGDLLDKVKQELQKGGAVSVTKVSVSSSPDNKSSDVNNQNNEPDENSKSTNSKKSESNMIDGKNIDDMSPEELKAALKKFIQKPDMVGMLKDKISNMYM